MPTIFRDRVEVGSVVFNVPAAKPAQAIEWGLDVLEGWDDTSELDAIETQVGGGVDGSVLGDFFPYRSRHLIVGGYATAATRLDAEALRDIIIRDAFPRNTDLLLKRFEAVPKSITARVSERREIAPTGPYAFRWIVPIVAPDPLKYGDSATLGPIGVAGLPVGGRTYPRTYPLTYTSIASGSTNLILVTNVGTAPAPPVVTIVGPLSAGAWRITNDNTGAYLTLAVALLSTDSLVIDFAEETALLNGAPVVSTVTGEFWRLEPGANTIRLLADFNASANFTITARSAWE